MKIVAINGSPRGPKSNTQVMIDAFFAGANKAGAETATVFLHDKSIHHCIGCFTCWTKTPGKCVYEDDMPAIFEEIKTADILIYASPLYADNITGLLKNFIDRLLPFADSSIELDANGEAVHPSRDGNKAPKLIIMSNCGFPEQSHFQVLSLYFSRLARNMHSEVIAEIYRSEGPMLTANHFLIKPIISKYKKLLIEAGEEIITYGAISARLQEKLEKPLVPPAQYLKAANEFMAKQKK